MSLDYKRYTQLLSKLIAQTQFLQNKPPEFVPQECLIANIVKSELDIAHISIQTIEYVPNRSNLIIKYSNPSTNFDPNKTLGIMGSHMDVVPANPSEWKHNPFELTIDELNPDILYGRGTTDCLGHIALLIEILKDLSTNNIRLDYTLAIVLISDEECGSDPTIGVSHMAKDKLLDFMKNNPIYWLDASDIYPTVGSGTGMAWELTVTGKSGHSGFPENTLNPILGANYAIFRMLSTFKSNFPKHPLEFKYNFRYSSHMKPTQLIQTNNSVNQIPESVTIRGDVRLVPFYDPFKVKEVMNKLFEELNTLESNPFESYHDAFKFELDSERMIFDLKWMGDPYEGIYCDLESKGFKLLANSTKKFVNNMNVVSSLGSLPLISDLKKMGFDMQIIGYGVGKAYHAKDEFCTFSGMKIGYDILMNMIESH